MSRTWDDVKNEMFPQVSMLEKLIRGYSYEDTHAAIATDEKFCGYIIEQLRVSKDSLFSVIELLYELEIDTISKILEDLRTDIDIFSDEIKVRHCGWEMLSHHWMKLIVGQDHELLLGVEQLNKSLEGLLKKAAGVQKLGRDPYPPAELEKVRKDVKPIAQQVHRLVVVFKEREAVCNIKSVSFERIYEKVKKDIEDRL
jgi:hypothetical protein